MTQAPIRHEEDELLRIGASSCGTPPASVEPIAFGDGYAGRSARSREPVFAQHPDPAELRDPGLREREIDSLLAVPLLARGAVIGVL